MSTNSDVTDLDFRRVRRATEIAEAQLREAERIADEKGIHGQSRTPFIAAVLQAIASNFHAYSVRH